MRRPFQIRHHSKLFQKERLLATEEVKTAAQLGIRLCQRAEFQVELDCLQSGRAIHEESVLAKVTPFLDCDGIMRVGGRLKNAPLEDWVKHPIILPRSSRITRLIVLHLHYQWCCASVERTLAQFRQLYWAPGGRAAVRSALSHCTKCKRRNAQRQIPLMAALPADRVAPSQPAFTITGVDFFGPLTVVIHRRSHKRHGCLFTCMTTRAVHIEVSLAGHVLASHGFSTVH